MLLFSKDDHIKTKALTIKGRNKQLSNKPSAIHQTDQRLSKQSLGQILAAAFIKRLVKSILCLWHIRSHMAGCSRVRLEIPACNTVFFIWFSVLFNDRTHWRLAWSDVTFTFKFTFSTGFLWSFRWHF